MLFFNCNTSAGQQLLFGGSERRRAALRVEKYVVQQLKSYITFQRDITTLEFELKALVPFDEHKTDGLIEELAFSHFSDLRVQSNHIPNRTATIALSYHAIGLEQTEEVRHQLTAQLEALNLQVARLDTYLGALPPEDAAVLRSYYFEGQSWQEISDLNHICLRTTLKRRERGMDRLVALYNRLAQLGVLPGVDPSS
ncbi:MAG: hypothetical protein ACLUBZ_00420 [Ruthenibacterium lactatiformans]|jgi:hypothetical protein|uniref:hypothetical protein n=1 Tax=Ruthenibacterium lactatiformans TaxID=1550024 RepID=UPI0039940B8F